MNATESSVPRHTRIVRMAGNPYLVLLSYRHHAVKKVSDPLPSYCLTYGASFCKGGLLSRFVVNKRAVSGTAAASRRFGADDTEDTQVVLHRRYAGLGRISNHLTNGLNLAVAFRTLAKHDVR